LPAAPAPEPAARVTVQIDTEPAGARVVVDGREVCSGTPCQFPAERGKEVEVEATKSGYRAATRKLTPAAETNQLTLELKRKERAASSSSGSRQEGDLKIPDAFGRAH
jgi:hypothetical protein